MRNIRQTGFTIVELLIVIVVIAILAAISIVAYNGISTQAATTVLKSDLANASRQLELNKVESGQYQGTDGTTTDGSPLKKSDGTTLQYTRTNNGQDYCLTATSNRSGVPAFHISSTNSSPQEGICLGHTEPIAGGGNDGTDIANGSSIQSVIQSQCQALPIFNGTNESAVRTVTDARGDTAQVYTIAKLVDNKCWMLDNLKLGSTTGLITLTSADSNVSSNFTLPQVGSNNTLDYDNPRVYGPVPGDTGSGATNYGYLYNWSAATAGATRTTNPAGSGNAVYSICPKGWRLPDGNESGEFSMLNAKMNNSTAGLPSTNSGSGYYQNWQNNGAFRGILSGYWSSGTFAHQNASGYFWSRTAYSSHAGNAFYGFFNATSVSPGHAGSRGFGQAIRCLLD